MRSFQTLVILFAGLVSSASAFVVSPNPVSSGILVPMTGYQVSSSSTALFSKTRLNYRENDEEDRLYVDNAVVLPAKPAGIYLPRRSSDQMQLMDDAEMIVGRIAMVAALIMFGTELVVGTSLVDQITNLFQ
jgi:hypothetical protein